MQTWESLHVHTRSVLIFSFIIFKRWYSNSNLSIDSFFINISIWFTLLFEPVVFPLCIAFSYINASVIDAHSWFCISVYQAFAFIDLSLWSNYSSRMIEGKVRSSEICKTHVMICWRLEQRWQVLEWYKLEGLTVCPPRHRDHFHRFQWGSFLTL